MRYVGSKRRIAKYILPIMLRCREKNEWWVEPFVGGGNMIDKVSGNRIGSDINKDVIDALKLIRDHLELIPKNNKEFTEDDYYKMKNDKNNILYGFVGFNYSFGSMFYRVWSRNKEKRDYVKETYWSAVKQHYRLQNVKLYNCSYKDLIIPKNSIIYCDPPYRNTIKYDNVEIFNYEEFYDWCREKSKNHKIYISEYQMPEDFKCIWSGSIKNNLSKFRKDEMEKLFSLNEIKTKKFF